MDATITHQINTNILKKKWSKQTQLKILKFKFKWASGFFRENFLSTYLYCKVPNVCCYGYQIRTKMRNLLIRTTHTSSLPSAFFIQMAQWIVQYWTRVMEWNNLCRSVSTKVVTNFIWPISCHVLYMFMHVHE